VFRALKITVPKIARRLIEKGGLIHNGNYKADTGDFAAIPGYLAKRNSHI